MTLNRQPIPTGTTHPHDGRARAILAKHAVDARSALIFAYADCGRLSLYDRDLKSWLEACREGYRDGSLSVGMVIALDTFMLGWRQLQPLDIDKAWHVRNRRVDPRWRRDYLAAMQDDAERSSDADLAAWMRPLRRHSEMGRLPTQIAAALDDIWSDWRVRHPVRRSSLAA